MKLRFHHGWGLDAGLWDAVAALLPDFDCVFEDRGYFRAPSPTGGSAELVIAHSFGTLAALRDWPAEALGLVAINGFDRFAAADDYPGVAPRVVDRMVARFADMPEQVLADFRRRCGADGAFPAPDLDRLGSDLAALRDWDCRGAHAFPILSLQGAADPIVPLPMQAAVFAAAADVERVTLQEEGHLLPASAPAFCAHHIRRFAEALATVSPA